MLGLDLSFRHDRWFDDLPVSARDEGRVELCVVRTGPGLRETPARVVLEPGRGVLGDAWAREARPERGAEVSLINVHVLRAIAGDAARMPLAGDNFVVDLDLSEDNLPPGSLLSIGAQVVLEVSTTPHRPCGKFVKRFGASAAKRVARAQRRGRRGRGMLCTVVHAGAVEPGDRIRVARRGGGA